MRVMLKILTTWTRKMMMKKKKKAIADGHQILMRKSVFILISCINRPSSDSDA